MPKAIVATTTTASPERNRASASRLCCGSSPAWNAIAGSPFAASFAATRSVLARRGAIDDAAGAVMARQHVEQLRRLADLRLRADLEVRAMEARDEHLGVIHAQRMQDVGAGARIRGGGQRDARHAGEAFRQAGERAVFRPELVAPLRDAMRLVDGEQRELADATADPSCRCASNRSGET